MDHELARHKVPHELISVAGAGHGLGGVDPVELTRIHERVIDFLKCHAS